jgi:beta-alanine--pyruvate transaminase
MDVFHWCYDHGVMVRYGGEVIAIGPPLTISAAQIGTIVDTIREAIRKTG